MASSATPLLPVADALARILVDVVPLPDEAVGIAEADGRVLAEPLAACFDQPPFAASAMDGYAVRSADVALTPVSLRLIGQSAAGHGFAGMVGPGEAVRIFTGAPMPNGTDTVVIQENAARRGDLVVVRETAAAGSFVRPKGGDFKFAQQLLPAGRRLNARDVSLAAAMGHGRLVVRRRPVVALLATGDELVAPGEIPGEDQIVSSVPFGLAGLVRRAGGLPQLLGIARDSLDSLDHHITRCRDADILVTIGGASVGEHDLVQAALVERGMTLDFWRIAMRPGKPLMYGRLDRQRVLGLPGNPVSAMLCGLVFLAPLVRALAGEADPLSRPRRARLARDVPANGPRAHYMRAVWEDRDGERLVRPLPDQDSSLVSVLAAAQCLAVIPANASALPAGSAVDVLELDF